MKTRKVKKHRKKKLRNVEKKITVAKIEKTQTYIKNM